MIKIDQFTKIIVANWKLNGSLDFIDSYFADLNSLKLNSDTCAIICPPSVFLKKCHLNKSNFFIGSQDCSKFENGAYTGEISAQMLKENNCNFCIVGHSERRQIFSETNEDIKTKSKHLIEEKIIPIVCVGETFEEKNKGLTKEILKEQVIKSLPKESSIANVIIAYEPIWAIGTGLTPSLLEIENIHYFLKNDIKNFKNYKILYGGSVKADNSKDIMNLNSVDGVLVGGASLNSIEFNKIINA